MWLKNVEIFLKISLWWAESKQITELVCHMESNTPWITRSYNCTHNSVWDLDWDLDKQICHEITAEGLDELFSGSEIIASRCVVVIWGDFSSPFLGSNKFSFDTSWFEADFEILTF